MKKLLLVLFILFTAVSANAYTNPTVDHVFVDLDGGSGGNDGTCAVNTVFATAKTTPCLTLQKALTLVNPSVDNRHAKIYISNDIPIVLASPLIINTVNRNASFGLTLQAWDDGGSITLVDGRGETRVAFDIDLNNAINTLFDVTSGGYVYLNGAKIHGQTAGQGLVVFNQPVTFTNCEIYDFNRGLQVLSQDVLINNVNFHDGGEGGTASQNSAVWIDPNSEVKNSRFYNLDGFGINAGSAVLIANNTFTDTVEHSIKFGSNAINAMMVNNSFRVNTPTASSRAIFFGDQTKNKYNYTITGSIFSGYNVAGSKAIQMMAAGAGGDNPYYYSPLMFAPNAYHDVLQVGENINPGIIYNEDVDIDIVLAADPFVDSANGDLHLDTTGDIYGVGHPFYEYYGAYNTVIEAAPCPPGGVCPGIIFLNGEGE